MLAVRLASLLRLAFAVRAAAAFAECEVSFELLELPVVVYPLPVVLPVEALLPEVVEPFAPLFDGLLNDVLLLVLELPGAVEPEVELAPDVLEEPLVEVAPFAEALSLFEAVNVSLAFSDDPPELL